MFKGNRLDLTLIKSVHVDGSVHESGLTSTEESIIVISNSVLQPVDIITLLEVLTGVSTTRLLTGLSTNHSGVSLAHQVLELEGLHEISVPNHRAISDLDISDLLDNVVHLLATLLESLLSSEDSGVVLHGSLHLESEISGRNSTVSITEAVEVLEASTTSVSRKRSLLLTGLGDLADTVGSSTTEDDDIEEGVGAETVGTVDGGAGGLTSGEETLDDLLGVLLGGLEDLSEVVGRKTTHVVVDGGEDGDGLLGDIDTSEDGGGLRDTGKSLVEEIGGEVVEVEVDVILEGTDTASLADFHGHGTGDDITAGEILGGGGVSLHETLTLRVSEDTTFSSATLGHEATDTVDTGGVELDELGILDGDTGSHGHGGTITSAGVGGGGAEVATTVTTGGDDGVLGVEAVDGAVFKAEGHDTDALLAVHDEVEGVVLDEVGGVVGEGATVEGVEHGVAGTIGGSSGSVGLTTFTVFLGLTTEGSLVDLAVLASGEGETVVLQLTDGTGGFTAHVVDGVLVTEPIGTLDGIVEVPSPVIGVHVTQSGIDTTLSGDGVGTSGEELGNDGGLEAIFRKTHSSTKTSTTSTDDDTIVLVVNNRISVGEVLGDLGISGRANDLGHREGRGVTSG